MSTENDGISPERMEQILQYQEITGVESIEVAEAQLIQFNWRLEEAIQDYLTANDASHTGVTSSQRIEAEVINPFEDPSSEDDNEAFLQRQRPQPVVEAGFFRHLFTTFTGTVLAMPLHVACSAIYNLYRFVHQLIFSAPVPVDPMTEVIRFINNYEETYGTVHPTFFRGTYAQALNAAKTELKFLVVYLHSSNHEDTPAFCRSTLSDPAVLNVCKDVVFWAVDINTGEANKVSRAMKETTYPYLSVVVLKNNKMTVVGRLEGQITSQQFTDKLTSTIGYNGRFIVSARADRYERELNASIRQQQDEAYKESLRIDREKAKKKADDQRIKEEEESKQKQEALRIQNEKTQRRQQKIDWADRIKDEPSEDCKEVVHILVKLPTGGRLERKFRPTDSLSALFYFVFCHPDSPERLEITTIVPKRKVPCEPTEDNPNPPTFQQFDIPNRSMLFVKDLEA